MNEIIIKTDGDVDVKDCKRAMLDYLKEHKIKFEYCHARETRRDVKDE